ncbi:MAG: YbaB/EbfC family nucleoid-associated protein [Deltaproteobacteria bacterium]|nr:YbaB/EbfC family nucleoid-associated protein [Sandaracinaceae bacterium]MCX7808846.1 YbaB/EbfC family nucleoid-associated protein [Deltaproteobacteria bacterium]MDW8246096.1 YbaB/EbfC family nucleoid-associated protein [Sandaracinaceae bacterium]
MPNQFRGGMDELLRQAARLQRKIESKRQELRSVTLEATAGNDQVKVVVNGGREIVSITIAPELLQKEDLSLVQDLIVAAVNAGLEKVNRMLEEELSKVAGGMRIPGLF